MTKISLNHGNSDKMTTFFRYYSKNFLILRQDIEKSVISSSSPIHLKTSENITTSKTYKTLSGLCPRAVSLLKETEEIEKQRPCKLHSLCRIVPDSQRELSAILF